LAFFAAVIVPVTLKAESVLNVTDTLRTRATIRIFESAYISALENRWLEPLSIFLTEGEPIVEISLSGTERVA
jgi:hypothetical protein